MRATAGTPSRARCSRTGWSAWLGLFTRRQLVNIGQGMVPQLADYDYAVRGMDADRNGFDDEAHEAAPREKRGACGPLTGPPVAAYS